LPQNSIWAKRIRVNVVASNARHSTGITLVGIEPEKEARISFIGKSVFDGRFFEADDQNKIIVGAAFLKQFNTKIDNKLIIMTQDTNNQIASKAFRIVGVYRANLEAVEKQFVFVPIRDANKMLKLSGSISEISILLPQLDIHAKREGDLAERLKSALNDENLEIKTWKELLPIIKAYLDMSDFSLYIWYLVVFVAMGFGIVNTTLMAIFERMREFGLMKALGMKPLQIIKGVLIETFFLLLIGITLGNLAGFVSVAAIAKNGIDLSSLAAGVEMWGMPRILYPEIWIKDVTVACLVVLGLGLVVSLYPAVKASRFTPVEAMTKH
jgi:ABC-type lipoprotein release transport system permease subunit